MSTEPTTGTRRQRDDATPNNNNNNNNNNNKAGQLWRASGTTGKTNNAASARPQQQPPQQPPQQQQVLPPPPPTLQEREARACGPMPGPTGTTALTPGQLRERIEQEIAVMTTFKLAFGYEAVALSAKLVKAFADTRKLTSGKGVYVCPCAAVRTLDDVEEGDGAPAANADDNSRGGGSDDDGDDNDDRPFDEGPACPFFSADRGDVERHIAREHAQAGARPAFLCTNPYVGGVANPGMACAATAVGALLATLPAEFAQMVPQSLRKAFRTRTLEDARAYLHYVNVHLPGPPSRVYDAVVRHQGAQDMASPHTIQETHCANCSTWTSNTRLPEYDSGVHGVYINGAANGAATALSAKRLLNEQLWNGQAYEPCGACKTPGARIHARTAYGKMLAINVMGSDEDETFGGLEAIPWDLVLPSNMDAMPEMRQFSLHGVVTWENSTHGVAYVANRQTGAWEKYDDRTHTTLAVGAQGPDSRATVFLLYRMLVPADAPRAEAAAEEEEEEESAHEDGAAGGAEEEEGASRLPTPDEDPFWHLYASGRPVRNAATATTGAAGKDSSSRTAQKRNMPRCCPGTRGLRLMAGRLLPCIGWREGGGDEHVVHTVSSNDTATNDNVNEEEAGDNTEEDTLDVLFGNMFADGQDATMVADTGTTVLAADSAHATETMDVATPADHFPAAAHTQDAHASADEAEPQPRTSEFFDTLCKPHRRARFTNQDERQWREWFLCPLCEWRTPREEGVTKDDAFNAAYRHMNGQHQYSRSGVSNRTLRHMSWTRCLECHDVMPNVPKLELLHATQCANTHPRGSAPLHPVGKEALRQCVRDLTPPRVVTWDYYPCVTAMAVWDRRAARHAPPAPGVDPFLLADARGYSDDSDDGDDGDTASFGGSRSGLAGAVLRESQTPADVEREAQRRARAQRAPPDRKPTPLTMAVARALELQAMRRTRPTGTAQAELAAEMELETELETTPPCQWPSRRALMRGEVPHECTFEPAEVDEKVRDRLQCPMCTFAAAGPRAQERVRSHIVNKIHSKDQYQQLDAERLRSEGWTMCLCCATVVRGSRHARAAHQKLCGSSDSQSMTPTRAVRTATQRARDNQRPSQTAGVTAGTEAHVRVQEERMLEPITVPHSAHDDAWLHVRPKTLRVLGDQSFASWRRTVRGVLSGYRADDETGRFRRQRLMTEVVREHLCEEKTPAAHADTEADWLDEQLDANRNSSSGHDQDEVATTAGGGTTNTTAAEAMPPPAARTPKKNGTATTAAMTAAEKDKAARAEIVRMLAAESATANEDDDGDAAGDPTRLAQDEAEQAREHGFVSRRVQELVRIGAVGRAARELATEKLPPATFDAATRAEVTALFPLEDASGYPAPPALPEALSIRPEAVAQAIGRGMARGAAPGMDGWTRELLYPLLTDRALLAELTEFVRDIARMRVDPVVARRLRATPLTVLQKPNGKLRPIAMESALMKLVGIVTLKQVRAAIIADFDGLQYGVFGNIEEAIRRCHDAFDGDADAVIEAIDGSNAYNTLVRSTLLERVYADQRLAPMWGVIALSLGVPGDVVAFPRGVGAGLGGAPPPPQEAIRFESSRGIRQGMVLGPLLYSLGTLDILREARTDHPECHIMAYLDDVVVVGKPDAVRAATQQVVEYMEYVGVKMNADKTTRVRHATAAQDLFASPRRRRRTEAMTKTTTARGDATHDGESQLVLGRTPSSAAPEDEERVPADARVAANEEDAEGEDSNNNNNDGADDDPTAPPPLKSQPSRKRVVVAVDTTTSGGTADEDGAESATAAATAPAAVHKILGAAFAESDDADAVSAWLLERIQGQARLFAALRSTALPRSTAFRVLLMAGLPRMNFYMRTHTPAQTQQAAEWFDSEVQTTLETMVGCTMDDETRTRACLPIKMGGLGLRSATALRAAAYESVGTKGAQRRATLALDTASLEQLTSTLSWASLRTLVAATARGAAAPLTDARVALPDSAFQVYLRQRLELRVLQGLCRCGEDATNNHVHACRRLPGQPVIARHDMIKDALEAELRQRCFHVAVEPHNLEGTSAVRPDLFVSGWGAYAATDVVVTNPAAVHHARTTGCARLAAAKQAAAEKERKWGAWAARQNREFAPVALEALGGMAPQSREWLKRLAMRSTIGEDGVLIFHQITAAVHVALHRGNAMLFETARQQQLHQ